MNDTPAVAGAAEQEREAPVWCIICARELPASVGEDVEGAERFDVQVGEAERAHLVARVVRFFVAFEHGLPTMRDGVAGDERSRLGALVAIHEAFDVTAIPSRLLRLDDCAHRRDRLLVLLRRVRRGHARGRKQRERE